MKAKRHTPEQVIAKLAEGDQMLNEGKTVAEVARSFGLSPICLSVWSTQLPCGPERREARTRAVARSRASSAGAPRCNAGSRQRWLLGPLQPRRSAGLRTSSRLSVPKNASTAAWSSQVATLPAHWRTPRVAQSWLTLRDRLWLPRSLCRIAPVRLPRLRRATSMVSTTNPSCILLRRAQPSTLREPRSATVTGSQRPSLVGT
jgi:hypothetical protein